MTDKHVFWAWSFRFTNNRQQCRICTTIPWINPHCLFWGCKGISSLLYCVFALCECFGVRLRFVFGHFNISRRGTLDWSYSSIKYAKICDHLNRYTHLNYLCSPDISSLPCSECENKWFSEWIPCIFGPDYGQSNTPKVKIRRPERSHSAVWPKIDPVLSNLNLNTSFRASSSFMASEASREKTRPSHLRTLSCAALAWLLATSPTGELAPRLPQLVTMTYSLFQEAPSCAFSSWLLNMWDPITAPWLAPLLGTFGLGLLCW